MFHTISTTFDYSQVLDHYQKLGFVDFYTFTITDNVTTSPFHLQKFFRQKFDLYQHFEMISRVDCMLRSCTV